MDKKKHIKDPGSAITHFIGMLMAIFAAVPLLIKAAQRAGQNIYYFTGNLRGKPDFTVCGKYHISYI